MLSTLPVEQVTALAEGDGGSILVATANPGRVYAVEGTVPRGSFNSAVRDATAVSSWGQLRWRATVPAGAGLQIQTRSGNTSAPDDTWSEWSGPYAGSEGSAVSNEAARFVQIRASLTADRADSPVLESLTLAYLPRNLPPQVESITVHPPGEVFQKPISVTGQVEILGLEEDDDADQDPATQAANAAMAAAAAFSRKFQRKGIQTFSWKASDPNGDELSYDVSFRSVDDEAFQPLRTGMDQAVLAWDTSTVPNGRYVVKVEASDGPDNPEGLSLTGSRQSAAFDVDNTPPIVTLSLLEGRPAAVRAVVRDADSIVKKAEFSVDGGRWRVVRPIDGIGDALEETYEIHPGVLPQGSHVVVVRGTDQLGNVASARVRVPGRP
jgi:hypothetical protein